MVSLEIFKTDCGRDKGLVKRFLEAGSFSGSNLHVEIIKKLLSSLWYCECYDAHILDDCYIYQLLLLTLPTACVDLTTEEWSAAIWNSLRFYADEGKSIFDLQQWIFMDQKIRKPIICDDYFGCLNLSEETYDHPKKEPSHLYSPYNKHGTLLYALGCFDPYYRPRSNRSSCSDAPIFKHKWENGRKFREMMIQDFSKECHISCSSFLPFHIIRYVLLPFLFVETTSASEE